MRAIGRLEVSQSPAEVAQKLVSSFQNQFHPSGTITKVGQCHHRALSAERHRVTTTPQLAHDFAAASGIRTSSQIEYRCLAVRTLYAQNTVVCPFDCIQQKNQVV